MLVELINTGTELMLGRILNTHQQWLCRELADLGYVVSRQVAVADTASEIENAVRESLTRADLVIATGGLGPTSDDLTRDRIAGRLGRKLHEDPEVLEHIRQIFQVLNRPMPPQIGVQALVPEGALVLANAHGTAPGLALKLDPNPFRAKGVIAWLILLPGPPRELRPMFLDSVVPLLKRELPLTEEFVCRTFRTTGIGESLVQEKIAQALAGLVASGLEVGYCARPGQVDVRLAAVGTAAAALVEGGEEIVRRLLARELFATGDQDLAQFIVETLKAARQTLALAESCTGGFIANQVTNVPGASEIFLGGLVTYSNEAKEKFLGVRGATLAEHGAVSEAVAAEMAEGARNRMNTDYALSATGIAGPSGGTAAKPVGTVFIGLAGKFETVVKRCLNPYDRETFKQVTAQQAFDLLRRKMGG